jgi:hypothetical protein
MYISKSQFKVVELASNFTNRLILESNEVTIGFITPLYMKMRPILNGITLLEVDGVESAQILENVPFPLLTNGYKVYAIYSEDKEYFVVCAKVDISNTNVRF